MNFALDLPPAQLPREGAAAAELLLHTVAASSQLLRMVSQLHTDAAT